MLNTQSDFLEVVKNVSINEAKEKQYKLLAELNKLKTQNEKNIEGFKDKIFALFKGVSIKTDSGNRQLEIAHTSDLKN